MFKKYLCLFLAITMVVGLTIPAVAANETNEPLPFTDVNAGDWFYGAVQYVHERGIMQGTSTTTFAPNVTLTRAQVVAILFRMHNGRAASAEDARSHSFTDVPNNWSTPYIAWAYQNNIVDGVGSGRFAPDNQMTREQLTTVMHRYASDLGYDLSVSPHVVTPAGTSNWAQTYMRWAVHNNFISAENPTGAASRADTANFVYRFGLVYEEVSITPEAEPRVPFTIDPHETHVFPNIYLGQAPPDPITVTVTNTGTQTLTDLTVSQRNAFGIVDSTTSITFPLGGGTGGTEYFRTLQTLAPEQSTSFTVGPRAGLPLGNNFNVNVIVSSQGIYEQQLTVRFRVFNDPNPPEQAAPSGPQVFHWPNDPVPNRFHRQGCSVITRQTTFGMFLSTARERGLVACRVCH